MTGEIHLTSPLSRNNIAQTRNLRKNIARDELDFRLIHLVGLKSHVLRSLHSEGLIPRLGEFLSSEYCV